ncbi:MAG TPA: hypothetical protein VGE12_06745 [Noviherbaspirillum sp.]
MKHCPHCNARLSFLRLLRATRWSPYVCPECHRRSRIGNIGTLGIVGLIGGFAAGTAFRGAGLLLTGAALVLLVLLVGLVQMQFVRLEPIDQ